MVSYNIHHVNGLYFELLCPTEPDKEFDVVFEDVDAKKVIYESKLKHACWSKLDRQYLSNIIVYVRFKGRTITQVSLLKELAGKKVFISFESKALGDTLAWMPYCEEFASHYKCDVIVSTFKNFLFEAAYPSLTFVGRGVVQNIFAMFKLGWDSNKEPVPAASVPLQQTASNILLLPFKEILPRIVFTPKERPCEEKYIAISIHSTSGLKLWHYWQEVVDYLVGAGYKVYEISDTAKDHKSHTTQPALINITELEDTSLDNTMNMIHHADICLGLSSGISWLCWALGKKVIMISNFTNKNHEFQSNCIRVYDESICHDCWGDLKFRFNLGDWEYCPRHEGTPRHFECHKLISAKRVIDAIKSHLL